MGTETHVFNFRWNEKAQNYSIMAVDFCNNAMVYVVHTSFFAYTPITDTYTRLESLANRKDSKWTSDRGVLGVETHE